MSHKCPYCFRSIGSAWQKDPILLPDGSKYKWSDSTELTLVEETDINKRLYKGFYIIEQEVKELQDAYKILEEERLAEVDRTTFSPIFDEINGIYQAKGIHIKELRESAGKLLTEGGLTLDDFFNYDEDRTHIIRPTGDQTNWTDDVTVDTDWNKFQIKAIHIEELRHYIYSESLLMFYNPHALTVDIGKESGQWTLTVSGSCETLGNPDTAIITVYNNPWSTWVTPTILQSDPRDFKIKIECGFGASPLNIQWAIAQCSFKFLLTKGVNEYSRIYNFGNFCFGMKCVYFGSGFAPDPPGGSYWDWDLTLEKPWRLGSFEPYNMIKSINCSFFNANNLLGADWNWFLWWQIYRDDGYLNEWVQEYPGWDSIHREHWMYDDDACLDNGGFWLRKRTTTLGYYPPELPTSLTAIFIVEANYNASNKYDFILTVNYNI